VSSLPPLATFRFGPLAPGPSDPAPPRVGPAFVSLKTVAETRKRIATGFVNRGYQPVDAEIDERRGIIRFREPVGHLEDTRIKTREQGRLQFPGVRITFAYEDSPAARQALKALGEVGLAGRGAGAPTSRGLPEPARGEGEVQYSYTYLAARGKDGAVEHLNPDLIDPPGAATLFPLVIHDDSFRMFVTRTGKTNKPDLDQRARDIASQHLLGPDDVSGEEGVAFGFFAIQPSSVIGRVRWEAGPGVTKTEWSVQNNSVVKQKEIVSTIARRLDERRTGP